MKRICVFDNEKMRIWLCKDTGTMNRPLRLTECTWCISWANVDISQTNANALLLFFGAFRGQTWIFHRMFVTCSLSVCYIIAIQKYGFCTPKVWFLACKKGVFERAYRYIGCVNCSNELCDRLPCTTLDGVFVCRKGRNKWIRRA